MVQSIFTDGREFPAENFAQGYTLLISHGDSAVIRTCILGADELYREGGVGEGAGTRIRGRWMEGRGRGGGDDKVSSGNDWLRANETILSPSRT